MAELDRRRKYVAFTGAKTTKFQGADDKILWMGSSVEHLSEGTRNAP
jgi:hypothetical protein